MTFPSTAFPCQRCGMVLFQGNLVCPNCGALVHARRLNDTAARAQQEEAAGNGLAAALIWRDALPLLPPQSQQYQSIVQRIGMLTSQLYATTGGGAAALAPAPPRDATPAEPPPLPKNDPWRLALAKTLGSMLVSIVVYTWLFSGSRGVSFGLQFASGFVLLMLVHELGHSVAMRYFRLSASPPIFIPFLGAAINMRQLPRNALEEGVVAIAGPIAGTIASGLAYLLYLQTGLPVILRVAEFSFLLNLLNMVPVPPLDGGRVTAAVSPWVWITGLLGVFAWMARDFFVRGVINPFFILLLLMAWPRVLGVLSGAHRREPYYQIGRPAKWAMGVAYVVLTVTLYVLFELCRFEAQRRFGTAWFG